MRNVYSIFKVLLLLAIPMSIISCGGKKQNDNSSNSDNNIDYAEIEKKGYKSGYDKGYEDGNDGKTYMASFNSKSVYHLVTDKEKVAPVWDRGYKKGYDDGFDEGKKNYDTDLAQRIEYAKQVLEEYEADNSSESTQRISSSTSSPNVASGSIHSNEKAHGNYPHYVETSNCVEGVVVYEGNNDYYIIETKLGYTIAEWYDGRLFEGDMLRGELNTYNFHYIINRSDNSEVRVYIQDYMLSRNKAIEWMGEHEKLKNRDQEAYNSNKDN